MNRGVFVLKNYKLRLAAICSLIGFFSAISVCEQDQKIYKIFCDDDQVVKDGEKIKFLLNELVRIHGDQKLMRTSESKMLFGKSFEIAKKMACSRAKKTFGRRGFGVVSKMVSNISLGHPFKIEIVDKRKPESNTETYNREGLKKSRLAVHFGDFQNQESPV